MQFTEALQSYKQLYPPVQKTKVREKVWGQTSAKTNVEQLLVVQTPQGEKKKRTHRPVSATQLISWQVFRNITSRAELPTKRNATTRFYTDLLTPLYLCSYLCWLSARWENRWLPENRYPGSLQADNTLQTNIMNPVLRKQEIEKTKVFFLQINSKENICSYIAQIITKTDS